MPEARAPIGSPASVLGYNRVRRAVSRAPWYWWTTAPVAWKINPSGAERIFSLHGVKIGGTPKTIAGYWEPKVASAEQIKALVKSYISRDEGIFIRLQPFAFNKTNRLHSAIIPKTKRIC